MEERTKKDKTPDDGRINYEKIGGGSMRLAKIDGKPGHRIIKQGQKFRARPDEIPEAFRDLVRPLEKEPVEPEPVPVSSTYTRKRRGNSNWYDIVDDDGMKLNEKALTGQQALDFIADLEK